MQLRGMNVERTDHVIIPHGLDRMVLGGFESGEAIIVAQRDGDGWSIEAPWHDAETVSTGGRAAAIQIMAEMATAVLPGDSHSTFVRGVMGADETFIPLEELP